MEVRGHKAIHKRLDLDATLTSIFQFEHAYIVDGAYLVIFEVGVPWFSNELVLSEKLVVQLSSASAFNVVTEFLEQMMVEAGASWIEAGTALALHDQALASQYIKQGFKVEALALTKDYHGLHL